MSYTYDYFSLFKGLLILDGFLLVFLSILMFITEGLAFNWFGGG